MLEVVSWDVDGTLYSLPRLRLAVGARLLRGVRDRRTWGELIELERWRAAMDVARRGGGKLAPYPQRERIRELERRWYGEALRKIGVRREFHALFARFAAQGIRQVVLSDYDSDYKLEALGLGFAEVFSGESIGWLKPSTELYREVGRRLQVEPARWLHIGDRVDRDIVPARSIGCQTLLIGDKLSV